VRSLRRARQQLSGFLLRQGCHYGRPAWTKLHRRWLAGLKFEQAVHHIVLEDYIAAVEAAEARRDRLTAQIEAMLPDWTLVPVVAALQTMRGMALVNAATLVAELGDLSRFANPRQLRAYLGLVPSEHSSGAGTRRGGLTKAGNSAARRLLIEAAWTYYFPARLGRELLPWQEEQPTPIREIAWKATAQTVHALSQARPHRQARQCRHRRDRPRAGRLCLGHRLACRRRRADRSTRAMTAKGGASKPTDMLPPGTAGGAVAVRRTLASTICRVTDPTQVPRPRHLRDASTVIRFQPAHQSMINRRHDGRDSCLTRQSLNQLLPLEPQIRAPATWKGGHESG